MMKTLKDLFFIIIALFLSVSVCSCDADETLHDVPPVEDTETVPPVQEPPAPVTLPAPVAFAGMTFCYYDVPGEIDTLEHRVDFTLEIYGTDDLDLRNIPLKFESINGFVVNGAVDNILRLNLSTTKPAKVTFVSDAGTIDYEVHVKPVVKQVSATEFDFHAGVNLSYWFQTDIPWPEDVTLEQIKECGFDHVRLPVDTYCLFDSAGNIKTDIMAQIHHVIEKSLDLGLNVIFDMHWLNAGNLFYQEPAAKELVNNWKKLMYELGRYPKDRLAYEVLNEPYGPGWGLMQRRMLHLMRHYEPERVIFVSPDDGYDVDSCAGFYLHKGDPNLVMTFHYYQPMLASHRKLWGYTGPSHYPGLLFSDEEWEEMSDAEREQAQWHRGAVYDYGYVHGKMMAAAQMAEHNGLRLHCGEFGYSKTNIREERLQWFRDIVRAFEANGIAYTVWENWGGDFGPGNWASEPDEEVIDILLQRE